MLSIIKYPFVFAAAYSVTILLTPLLIWLFPRIGLIDQPDERRIHPVPIPRGGGVAVFIGFHVGCAVRFLIPWEAFEGRLTIDWWYIYLSISSLLLLVGLVDDRHSIRPLTKLIGQIVVASVLFFWDVRMGKVLGVELPFAADYLFSVLWMVGITNAFNLIDGLDGLATGLALIACVGIGSTLMLRGLPGDALIFIALAGGCSAFLRFNFSPAKIFLGDSGSMFLGMTIASIALETGSKGTAAAALGVPLLAVGVPVFDTVLAIWRRSMRKMLHSPELSGKISAGDTDHIHHRLLKSGLSQQRVALVLYTASAVLISVGLLSAVYHSHAVGIYVLAFAFGSYVIVRHVASVELWDSAAVIARGLPELPTAVKTFVAYPIVDFTLLTLALAAALLLSSEYESISAFRADWFRQVPVWCGLSFIGLLSAQTYSKVWSRARISDYGLLILVLAFGAILSLGMTVLELDRSFRNTFTLGCLYFGLAATMILGVRSFRRVVQDVRSLFVAPSSTVRSNLLVYGADFRALLYYRYRTLNEFTERGFAKDDFYCMVGFVDDDPNLRNRIVHGYRVLGHGTDLERIVREFNIAKIVITAPVVDEESLARLSPDVIVKRFSAVEGDWTPTSREPRASQAELKPFHLERG